MRISDWSSDVCSSDLPFFQRLDVIVAKGDDFRIAHLAPVIDGRMAVDVEDDIVTLARDGRNDAEVRLIAGRKDHGMIHGVKFLERFLALLVAPIGDRKSTRLNSSH